MHAINLSDEFFINWLISVQGLMIIVIAQVGSLVYVNRYFLATEPVIIY